MRESTGFRLNRISILTFFFALAFVASGSISASEPQQTEWVACGDLKVNPVHRAGFLKSPMRVVFVFEGNSGYHPKTAAALRESAPYDLSYDVDEGGIAAPFALDSFVRREFSIPASWRDADKSRPADQVSTRNWAHRDTYWLYYSFGDVSTAVKCAEKIAKLRYQGPNGPVYSSLTVVGFSNGGSTAFSFSNRLAEKGVKVDLGISVDPIKSPTKVVLTLFVDKFISLKKPKNATRWVNYYQKNGTLLRGRSVATADVNVQIKDVKGHLEITDRVRDVVGKEVASLAASRLSYFFDSTSGGKLSEKFEGPESEEEEAGDELSSP